MFEIDDSVGRKECFFLFEVMSEDLLLVDLLIVDY